MKRFAFLTLLLVVFGTAWVLFLHHTAEQEPIKVYLPTPIDTADTPKTSQQPKEPPTPVETTPHGHYHADGTWHTEPHVTSPISVEIEPHVSVETYTYDVAQYESHPKFDPYVQMYRAGHSDKHPDCVDSYQAVTEDAKRYAAWLLASDEYDEQTREMQESFDRLMLEGDKIFTDAGVDPSDVDALFQYAESMSESERLAVAAKLQAILDEARAVDEALQKKGPVAPEPTHTH